MEWPSFSTQNNPLPPGPARLNPPGPARLNPPGPARLNPPGPARLNPPGPGWLNPPGPAQPTCSTFLRQQLQREDAIAEQVHKTHVRGSQVQNGVGGIGLLHDVLKQPSSQVFLLFLLQEEHGNINMTCQAELLYVPVSNLCILYKTIRHEGIICENNRQFFYILHLNVMYLVERSIYSLLP